MTMSSAGSGAAVAPPLTAVALVAALLICTIAANSAAAATPPTRTPSRDASQAFEAGSASSRGDDDGNMMIVPAFVAAVTSCCYCCPTVGDTCEDGDNNAAPETTGRVPAGRPTTGTGTPTLGNGEPQCLWCRVLHESQSGRAGDREEDGKGCTYSGQEEEEEEEDDGPSEEMTRSFVNLWSKVQAAVWHVNACLAVLRLTTPAANGGGRGGGALSPVDPLRLRPALALELFRKRERLRRLCQRPPLPNPGKQRPGQRQQHLQRQQQKQQDRAVTRPPAPRGGGRRSTRASRSGSSGAAANHPVAQPVGARGAEMENQRRRQGGRRHPGPLPCREQRGRCCRIPPYGGGCAWAGRVQQVLGAVGFAFPV